MREERIYIESGCRVYGEVQHTDSLKTERDVAYKKSNESRTIATINSSYKNP